MTCGGGGCRACGAGSRGPRWERCMATAEMGRVPSGVLLVPPLRLTRSRLLVSPPLLVSPRLLPRLRR